MRLVQDAIGINYVDVMVRAGLFPKRLPATPGFEAAGVIDSVGLGVTDFAPGDRAAYFFVEGACATASLVPAERLVRYRFDQIGVAHADMESRRPAGLPVLTV